MRSNARREDDLGTQKLRRLAFCGTLLLAAALAPACRRSAGLGRSVTLLAPGDVLTLDPNRSVEWLTYSVLINVFEPLVGLDSDLRVTTALAESWEHPSPERWRFHLRKGASFHDGTPLTAQVARDALLAIQRDPSLEAARLLGPVVRIEAVGDGVLDLVTSEPRALLPNLYSVFLTKKNAAGTFPPLVGTGPYRLDDWTRGERVALERWDGYWGPRPFVGKARFLSVPDAEERLTRIGKGEAEIAYAIPPERTRDPLPAGVALVRGPGLTVFYLAFNVRNVPGNPFRDARVRRAFHLAIDRAELVKRAGGVGVVATQPVSPLVFGYNPRIPPPLFDPARARALLAEAGWKKELRVRLDVPGDRLSTGRFVEEALESIGVSIELRPLPRNAVYDLAEAGKSDFFFAGWDCTSGEASEFYEFNLRTPTGRTKSGNYGGYSNRRLDELADRNAAALEGAKKKELLEEAAAIVMDELPVLPLYVEDNIFAVRRGVTLHPPADGEIRLVDLGRGGR